MISELKQLTEEQLTDVTGGTLQLSDVKMLKDAASKIKDEKRRNEFLREFQEMMRQNPTYSEPGRVKIAIRFLQNRYAVR